MARTPLDDAPLALNDADLENVARVAERLLAGRALAGAGASPHRRRVGAGLEFHDFRAYVHGDELRHVDWRASARSRELQLRRYREEVASQWTLCLDRSASMSVHRAGKWRLGAEVAAAFAYVLLALSCRVSLVAFSSGVDAVCALGRGQRHYGRILETLAAYPATASGSGSGSGSELAACIGAIRPDTSLVVISDFLVDDAMEDALARLSRLSGRVHAIRIAARSDYSALPQDALTLRDAETGQEKAVIPSAALDREAALAWEAHLARWNEVCRTLSIRATTAWTGGGWKQALLDHLMTLGGGRA